MNAKDIIKTVAVLSGESQAVTATVISSFLDSITKTLSGGEDVRIHGFGTFTVKDRAERIGRNPQTGAPVNIAASRSIKFKATKGLV